MDLKPPHLVIALRNANKRFWRRCHGGHRLKNLVGHDHEHMHVMVATIYEANSAYFLPIVDENRIVYEWFCPTKKLHQ
jgi:hypothetical protein